MARAAYIHIPFCAHKCDFCDFAAFASLDHLAEEYCQVVQREIKERLAIQPNQERLSSVFYGGGTPGYIDPDLLSGIHRALSDAVALTSDAEVTLETTPRSISREKCLAWQELGINRLSLGVESFDEGELRAMGRDHSGLDALRAIEIARQTGFENIAIDLMYGLPCQTMKSWEQNLETATSAGVPHLSAYALTLGSGSRLFLRYPRSSPVYPDDDLTADMYETLVAHCRCSSLLQYEISNFALTGLHCRHNLTYWLNEEFLAFGVSAHRYIGHIRSSNYRSLKRYMRDYLGYETFEELDRETRAREAIFLGLRLSDGLDLLRFKESYGFDPGEKFASRLEQLVEGGFVLIEEGRLKLSLKGMLVSNLILADFI